MALIQVNEGEKKFLRIAILIAVLFGVFFLKQYAMLIVFASIMAFLFSPLHDFFIKKGKSEGASGFYTFIVSMLVIIIPIVFIALITFFQIDRLVNMISDGNYNINLTDIGTNVIAWTNQTLANLGINHQVSIEQIAQNFSTAVSNFGKTLFSQLINSFSSIFGLITNAIIYIYVFFSILKNKKEIILTFKRLNPLGDEVSELYLNRTAAMTKATVRGQFIIAAMQGFASAAVLSLVGFNNLFFFFLLLLTLMSIIPLGAGIITIPIGIVMILMGNVWQGAVIILNHLLIVTNIDNVMRPKLVPKTARLDPALMILAVFAGLGMFGFLGIVIGPIIMILIVTTIQIYTEVFYKVKSIDNTKEKKTGFLKKLRSKV